MRKAIAAGQFYPSSKKELRKQIEECFLSKFGPGKLPSKKEAGRIRGEAVGVISPHAGYSFSGPCQAFSYKELAECESPDTYIILGLSHNGFGSCISQEDWETPLGRVENDIQFQKAISDSIPVDESGHNMEHSIEVQLPFLQFIDDGAKIAPIIVSPDKDYNELAKHIFDAIIKTGRRVKIIASSDFTHYGANYGYVPFREDIKENMYNLDKGAISQIEALSAEKFLEYTRQTKATICGQYPIAVLLEISKMLGAKKASLLKYYTSGDILGDYSNSVGYASIKID